MCDLMGLNVTKSKVRYAHFTFFQQLALSQTFITSKKINYDSKEKNSCKKHRTRICVHSARGCSRCPFDFCACSGCRQTCFNGAIYASAI